MTKPFVFDDAVAALRGVSGDTCDPDLTRRRILGTVSTRKRRRQQLIAVVAFTVLGLPLGTTAYAAFFGTPRFLQAWFTHQPPTHAAASPNTPAPVARHNVVRHKAEPAVEASAVADTSAVVEAPVIEASATDSHATYTAPSTRASSARASDTKRTTAVTPPKSTSADDDLYRRAHQLHFVVQDPAAALDAWDRYITHAPAAALLPEAHYNRALCLVRLARHAEAIDALTPFAHGTHGTYRKREATALITALQR